MKQSITYLKQGLAFPFWLTIALLSGLSGYVTYAPTPLRATYRTEVVYVQKNAAEQVQVKASNAILPYVPDKQPLHRFTLRWYQCQQQVAFRQTTQQYHSIKMQQQLLLHHLPVYPAGEPPLLAFFG